MQNLPNVSPCGNHFSTFAAAVESFGVTKGRFISADALFLGTRLQRYRTLIVRVHRNVMRGRILLFALLFWSLFALAADPVRCPPAASHMHVDKGEYVPQQGIAFGLTDFSATMVPRGPR